MQPSISQITVLLLFVTLQMSEYNSAFKMPENLEKHYKFTSIGGWCTTKWIRAEFAKISPKYPSCLATWHMALQGVTFLLFHHMARHMARCLLSHHMVHRMARCLLSCHMAHDICKVSTSYPKKNKIIKREIKRQKRVKRRGGSLWTDSLSLLWGAQRGK